MRFRALFAIGLPIAVALFGAPAVVRARHSTGEIDYIKTVSIAGEVNDVRWTNPDADQQILATTSPVAGPGQWGVEIGAPAIEVRMGWLKDSVKPGDYRRAGQWRI